MRPTLLPTYARRVRPVAWWRRWWPQGGRGRRELLAGTPDPADVGICLGLELSLQAMTAEGVVPSRWMAAT